MNQLTHRIQNVTMNPRHILFIDGNKLDELDDRGRYSFKVTMSNGTTWIFSNARQSTIKRQFTNLSKTLVADV